MTTSSNPASAETHSDTPPQRPGTRADLALRLIIASELALIAVTKRLWFAGSDFPRIPMFDFCAGLPALAIQAVSGLFVISLVYGLCSGWSQRCGPRPAATVLMLVSGLLTVVLNQHCLQAWHWLFLLMTAAHLLLPAADLIIVLRRMVPCIYLFAALSRFGPGIDAAMSPRIVRTLLDLTGLSTLSANPAMVSRLCVAVTLFELFTGLLLFLPKTRRWGMPAAVLMHLTLLVVLGPWGLQQHIGVLIWNATLALWVVTLYARSRLPIAPQKPVITSAASILLLLWPAAALFGFTDNWTGWQLYSPRPEVLRLQIHADEISRLPESLQPYVSEPQPLQNWCHVRLDRWSLQAADVPLYPQARFQIAVALAATAGLKNDDHVRAILDAPNSPVWWHRNTSEFNSRTDLERQLSTYRLVANPADRT